MTKKEIIWLKPQFYGLDKSTPEYVTMKSAMEAMEEYAKQQCISFGFHVLGADPNDPEMGGAEAMSKTYDQFIEQQNKTQ